MEEELTLTSHIDCPNVPLVEGTVFGEIHGLRGPCRPALQGRTAIFRIGLTEVGGDERIEGITANLHGGRSHSEEFSNRVRSGVLFHI